MKTNSLQYAWTASLIGQNPIDTFNMEWSSGDGLVYDFTMGASPFPRIANEANNVKDQFQDITYTTQSAIVGQPLVLVASGLGESSTPNWTLPGTFGQTFIGGNGFTPHVDTSTTPSNIICNSKWNCPGLPALNNEEITVYFTQAISPASAFTYQITAPPPSVLSETATVTASASASFSILAPTLTGPTFTSLKPVGVQTISGVGQFLGWGAQFRDGVQIGAAVTPPDIRAGTVYWYNVITRDKLVYYANATSYQIYSCSTGFDDPSDALPVSAGSTFTDGPNVTLAGNANNYVRISMTYEFRAYLMWIPNIKALPTNGISPTPIPLGYETWGFTADAIKTVGSDGTIVWVNTPTAAGGVNAPINATFTAGSAYPQWNQVVIPGTKFYSCSPV